MKIIPFNIDNSAHKEAFYTINHQWISTMFVMEEVDEMALRNPQDYILKDGGFIFLLEDTDQKIIGTIALKKTENDQRAEYELTKMGVLNEARGSGAGKILLEYTLEFIKENDFICYLLTNSACKSAIHLYEKYGFVHSEDIMKRFGGGYERCDVAMVFKSI